MRVGSPPFTRERECYSFRHDDPREFDDEFPSQSPSIPPVILPALLPDQRELRPLLFNKDDSAADDGLMTVYLRGELSVSGLNKVHKHLWLAGQQRPIRALHEQHSIGRQVVLTANASCHLLWKNSELLVKPCPDFLLSRDFWDKYLCSDQQLHEDALGLLLSYVMLVRSRTDFQMAINQGILPQDTASPTSQPSPSWPAWRDLCVEALQSAGPDWADKVNPRYHYGELRLHRINWIYRLCSRTRSLTVLFRGYRLQYHDYTSFFRGNFAWISGVTVYIALVLTAMQVGLSVDVLSGSRAFQNASYGFTVFSILGPVIVISVLIFWVMGTMVLVNLHHTVKLRKSAEKRLRHETVWKHEAINKWKH